MPGYWVELSEIDEIGELYLEADSLEEAREKGLRMLLESRLELSITRSYGEEFEALSKQPGFKLEQVREQFRPIDAITEMVNGRN